MKPPFHVNIKRICHMKFPFGLSGFTFKRMLAVKSCEVSSHNFLSVCRTNKICNVKQFYSNSPAQCRYENYSSSDDEYTNRESSGDFYSFRVECDNQEQLLVTQLQIISERADQITNQEWNELVSLVLKTPGTITEKNVDAIILKKCGDMKSLSLGKAYFKHLKDAGKMINRATYGNYLYLFFLLKSECTVDDLNEILVTYRELIEVYPLLDSHTAEKAVCALSITTNWKEYEKLFVTIKKFYHPTINVYKVVILTAFEKQELDLGWKLMEEMECQGLEVPEEVFLYWFEKVKSRKMEEDLIRVLKFFDYFNRKPTDNICKGLTELFENCNEGGTVAFTSIARNGECRSCKSMLETCYVPQEDFDELKKAFLDPVVIGKDIFRKTKPEEFQDFLEFLKKSGPFNVVIDGLNVALDGGAKSVRDKTYRLKSVVKHYSTLNKNILVLGRKHMTSWDSPNMEYVYENARLFLTDNLSQDDPYMLYAALYSGLGCCFVSRDLMRGHRFLLVNPKLQTTFQKWQATHQIFITHIGTKERVFFQDPIPFLQTIQRNDKGDWHVPYRVKGEELTNKDKVDHLHRHWLCLQKQVDRSAVQPHKEQEWQRQDDGMARRTHRAQELQEENGMVQRRYRSQEWQEEEDGMSRSPFREQQWRDDGIARRSHRAQEWQEEDTMARRRYRSQEWQEEEDGMSRRPFRGQEWQRRDDGMTRRSQEWEEEDAMARRRYRTQGWHEEEDGMSRRSYRSPEGQEEEDRIGRNPSRARQWQEEECGLGTKPYRPQEWRNSPVIGKKIEHFRPAKKRAGRINIKEIMKDET